MSVRGSTKGTASFLGAIAAVRMALGGGMLVLPALSARLLGAGRDAADSGAWLARMVGARELALGVVALGAAVGHGDARWALLAQVAADSGDAATFAYAVQSGRLPARSGVSIAAFAAAAVAVEAVVAARETGGARQPLPEASF